MITAKQPVVVKTRLLKWDDLRSSAFAVDKPVSLRMQDGEVFTLEAAVRLIPKRRLVAFGVWQGKAAVAKLFFDPKHAKRHCKKDVAGITILQERKIPAPKLLYQGVSEDKRVQVLIFEKLRHAKSAEDLWENKQNIESIFPQLKALLVEIATQHVLGVVQHDLHFNNFMLTSRTVYTLDGGQVELHPYLLPKKISMQNLALFLSQFGVGHEDYQERLFRDYADLRGWRLKDEDMTEMFLMIKQCNERRWQKYSEKIIRNSTDFARKKTWRTFGVYDKAYQSPELMAFLEDPEKIFTHPKASVLKDGRSSTVIKVQLDHHLVVIKRYNMKNMFHFLRRCFRPTRAAVSWRLAHKLRLFSVPTARPIAYLENRYAGLRGSSYYITEYVAGGNVSEFMEQHHHDTTMLADMAERVTALLKNLSKLDMTHGDLKATNILLDERHHPTLIDLDGAAEHFSVSSLHKAWRKEIKRFLANFQSGSPARQLFEGELK